MLLKALSKRPEHRFRSARQFLEALLAAFDNEPLPASMTDTGELETTVPSVDETPSGTKRLTPGNLSALLNGAVNGQLINVPILGTINLGTLYNIVNAPLDFAVPLPGNVTTSDLNPLDPIPHDMQAQFSLAIGGMSIPFPFSVPVDVALSQSVPNGQSGFSVLNVDADLNATITMSNLSYLYTGVVANTLVPEPSVALLVAAGLLGLGIHGRRARR